MEYEIYKADDELTHWGVRGMKWGIRRYQNKDGSLTKAGQRRYKAESEKLKQEEAVLKKRKATKAKFDRLAAKRKAIEDEKKALDEAEGKVKKEKKGLFGKKKDGKDEKPKTAKDMTDEELILAINRARLEDTYNHLRPEQVVEKPKFMSTVLNDVAIPALKSSGRKALEGAIDNFAKKALEGKVDPDSLDALKLVRDKLQVRKEIEKLKSGKTDDDLSWEDRLRKQKWESNERKLAREEADEKAANRAAADEAARKANERRSQEEYEKSSGSYRYTPDRSTTTRSNPAHALSLYTAPVSSISTTSSSRGKSYADDTFSNWQDIHKDRGGLPSSSTIRLGQSHIAGYLPAPKGDDD